MEEARERSVCHIETIQNSVIVSPSTDWTNFTAGKAGNSEKLETEREREEENDKHSCIRKHVAVLFSVVPTQPGCDIGFFLDCTLRIPRISSPLLDSL